MKAIRFIFLLAICSGLSFMIFKCLEELTNQDVKEEPPKGWHYLHEDAN